jgi:hypothetical protein
MDQKTEELRDILMDVADDGTVTESQEESPGSLTQQSDVDAQLAAVVAQLRDRYGFETALSDETLVDVVRCFYDGQDDEAIGVDVGRAANPGEELDTATVFRARMDLHLVRGADLPDGDPARELLRDVHADGVDAVADALDVDHGTASRYVRALDAREESRGANDRYRDAFEDALTDAGLTTNLDSAREDGLDEATAGMEVDVDF